MKKMFIVSAIMLFAVGAMTSCKDSVENGCHCTETASYQGKTETEEEDFTAEEVKAAGNYNSCKAFAADYEKKVKEYIPEGASISISCKGK